jgi:two-component system, cell cycle response regulator
MPLILVVDDAELNIELLERKLENGGFETVRAVSGASALEAAQKHLPDLILLDVMMPVMDGFEVCRRLRADPRAAEIPIILLTALSDPADRLRGFEAGADDFLTKPIADDVLFARIRSAIRARQKR